MTSPGFAWLSSCSTRSQLGKTPTATVSVFPVRLWRTPSGSCVEDVPRACMSMYIAEPNCCLVPSRTPVGHE